MEHNTVMHYKRAKTNLNAEHNRYMSDVFKDINEALVCAVCLLWKLLRRIKPHTYRACIYTIIEDNGKSFDDPPGVSRLLSIFEKLWLNPTTIENFYADLKRAKDSLNAYFTGGP